AACAGLSVFAPSTLVAALGSAAIYAGGVALNDVADVEKDRALHPERPLPSGAVPVAEARRGAWWLLAGGAATALIQGPTGVPIAVATVAAVVAYDLLRGPGALAGALFLGAARGFNLLRGAAGADALEGVALYAALFHAALIACVTVISAHEDAPVGAPTPAEARRAARLLPAFYFGPAVLALRFGGLLAALLAAAGGVLLAVFATRSAFEHPPRYAPIVPRAVFSLILFDALYVLVFGGPLQALAVAALLPASLLLKRALAQRGA
ncbi:MAG TPA: UbiA family prenyltransferase, partial [Planctomycetota bacterium]|nr:UbiA family prenyltransferase [Planctomycetota bacterium]